MPSAISSGPVVAVLLLALGTTAPFQCTSEPDPNKAFEETPGEALYKLAQQFREKGDPAAYRQTLEFLVERYPSSRFAVTAREELASEPP